MSLRHFFARHGLSAYVDAFEREHVDIADLGHLTDDDLRGGFGMNAFMDRKRFKAMVAELAGVPVQAMLAPSQPTAPASGVTRVDVGASAAPVDPGAWPTGPLTPVGGPGATRVDTATSWPTQIGNYRVLGILGAGGMGTVLRARHTVEAWAEKQGGDVAIKLIHPHLAAEASFQRRFFDEASLGRSIHHPGLVPVYDVVTEGTWLGTVMGFVTGEPLARRVRAGGLPVDEVVAMLAPVADTLDHLHARGIVHRDVKPANIVVRADGLPVVLDLGIAKDLSAGASSQTQVMSTLGTTAWMAPEQADARNVDGAADRYAFGLVAYALLAGRMPWDEGTTDYRLVSMKFEGKLPALSVHRPDAPDHVARAVMQMLSAAPTERFPTCVAFVEALRTPADPFETWTVDDQSLRMRHVEPCAFVMGSPVDEAGREAEAETPHTVTLTRAYAIGTTPVTQALYEAVTGTNPSEHAEGPDAPQRPVETLTWFDAVRFCNALSTKMGLQEAYVVGEGETPEVRRIAGSDGFRLPTEAEWECAARSGGDPFVYAGGNDPNVVGWYDDKATDEEGERTREPSCDATQPVATRAPTRWGLYDMTGNVWEWCEDWFGAYPGSPVTDPTGPTTGIERANRGGSYDGDADLVRVANRGGATPLCDFQDRGVRLARSLEPQAAAAYARARSEARGELARVAADLESAREAARASAARAKQAPRRIRHVAGLEGSPLDMVVVPPCTFARGLHPDNEDASWANREHLVTLTRSYAVATTQVTQGLYASVVGTNPAKHQQGPDAPRRPVESVTWFDAVRFCNLLSGRVGLTAAYTIGAGDTPRVARVPGANGFRLPTDAEWECAARSVSDTYVYAGSNDPRTVAWYRDDERTGGPVKGPQPVATLAPTRWGLYDMSGNVAELCEDDYVHASSIGHVTDPCVDDRTSGDKVERGGEWDGGRYALPVASREQFPFTDGYTSDSVGFRLVRTVCPDDLEIYAAPAVENARPSSPTPPADRTLAPVRRAESARAPASAPKPSGSTASLSYSVSGTVTRQTPVTTTRDVEEQHTWLGITEKRVVRKQFTEYVPRTETTQVAFEMAVIPAQTFWMGSPPNERGRLDDEIYHEVTLTRSYAVARLAVTWDLYEVVQGMIPPRGGNADSRPPTGSEAIDHVNWNAARSFCDALSRKLGLTPAYNGSAEPNLDADGFRLPSEAEWECAARFMGALKGTGREWCQDAKKAYPSGKVTDPRPGGDSFRVVRNHTNRIAARHAEFNSLTTAGLGFRVVRTVR